MKICKNKWKEKEMDNFFSNFGKFDNTAYSNSKCEI